MAVESGGGDVVQVALNVGFGKAGLFLLSVVVEHESSLLRGVVLLLNY